MSQANNDRSTQVDKVLLAAPRGFCAGVYMAIDVVDQLLDICPGETIHVYHEIVHNMHVVNRFRDRGVRFIEELSEVPDGSIVVFSAHGVSPALRKQAEERRLTAIDATCPLVTKVHNEAIRYAKAGYQILLVGHKNHQEVVGTRGEAPDAIQVVECPEDIPDLVVKDPNKLVYLTQTTLSTDDANVIIAALKKADDGIPRTVAPVEEVQLFVRDASGTHDVTLRELESKTMGAEVTRSDLQISVAGDGEILLTTRQDGMIRTFVP